MGRVLSVTAETFPIAGAFTISRGTKTEAEVIVCSIEDGDDQGWGECVPYRRYGETIDSVRAQILAAAPSIRDGIGRRDLMATIPAGAARNAIDCALWDLEAKAGSRRVEQAICREMPRALTTAYTLSLDTPERMANQAKANAHRPLLKVKLGSEADVDRMRAIAGAAPNSRLIVDANEGWASDVLEQNLAAASECGVALIEQPLPAGEDAKLAFVSHRVPICADESVHTVEGLEALVGRYDAINIKLDKTGGLTAALELRDRARELGFSIMVGCMVGTSLAMAPAVLLAQDAEFVDLDGPLLLARDRVPALQYEGSLVSPPVAALWG